MTCRPSSVRLSVHTFERLLDRFVSNGNGVKLIVVVPVFVKIPVLNANSVVPDRTPHSTVCLCSFCKTLGITRLNIKINDEICKYLVILYFLYFILCALYFCQKYFLCTLSYLYLYPVRLPPQESFLVGIATEPTKTRPIKSRTKLCTLRFRRAWWVHWCFRDIAVHS